MYDFILVLFLLIFIYWLIPLILIIIGLTRLKSNPKSAKKNLIIAGVMLLIGGGVCGFLMNLG
jgi:hypothetical protein